MTAIALIRAYWKPLAVFLLLLMTWLHGHHTGDTGRDAVWSARWHKHVAEDTALALKAEQDARKQEQDWVAAFDLTTTLMLEEKNNVAAHRDRLLSDLRAGRLRVPSACPRLPEATADSGQPQAAPDSGQPGLAGDLASRLAVCDEVTIERNQAVRLLEDERR